MHIIIINGPNLNLLGKRETGIYGEESFPDYFEKLQDHFPVADLEFFQSNVEGEIIDLLQKHGFSADGIILNAGGYSHTSVSIADAVRAIPAKVVEVHISNLFSREEYRRNSLIAPHTAGLITGFGLEGYRLAVQSFLQEEL